MSRPFFVGCHSAASFGQTTAVELRQEAAPHASLVDMRHLERVDPTAFEIFLGHIRSRSPLYRERVKRQARVRPDGLAGAIVAGFDKLVTPAYPIAVHDTLDDAFAWLCRAERTEVLAEIDAITAAARGDLPMVQRLRRVLVPPLAGVTMESVARSLGLSTRTLQRRLQDEGTTFQVEHSAARVRAAQALLSETEVKLATIALEVGYSSLASFSTMFRRVTGESPSAWRDRSRRQARGEASPGCGGQDPAGAG